ncbi:MAG TPA: DUF1015 domain-containing protein, partial [Acidobacteriota bacterium]|nr:DUF1015 domain-containing protein [Acidobacteriota bacterium]
GIVLPHEATLSAPKEDRLNLLRACKANFSPIFGIYSDPEQTVDALLEPFTSGRPDFVAEDEAGVTNSVWNVSDPALIREVQKQMNPKWVLIADGHHRYESCLLYRDEMSASHEDPDAFFQFTMMFFTNIHHPGITVLPYNRGVRNMRDFDASSVLKKAETYFAIRKFDEEAPAMLALEQEGQRATAFLALMQGQPGFHFFRLRPEVKLAQFYSPKTPQAVWTLDVNILHKVMIQHVLGITEEEIRQESFLKYYKEIEEEKKDFLEGRLQMGFFLNPTRIEQVVEVSKAGAKMPQKSTFFYPKLMTGFVINLH